MGKHGILEEYLLSLDNPVSECSDGILPTRGTVPENQLLSVYDWSKDFWEEVHHSLSVNEAMLSRTLCRVSVGVHVSTV